MKCKRYKIGHEKQKEAQSVLAQLALHSHLSPFSQLQNDDERRAIIPSRLSVSLQSDDGDELVNVFPH